MDEKRKTPGIMGRCSEQRAEHPSQHKAHEEQPPAAARARGFAAKNAPAGQRQIRTNIQRDELDIELPAPASATAPAKDGFGRLHGQPALRC